MPCNDYKRKDVLIRLINNPVIIKVFLSIFISKKSHYNRNTYVYWHIETWRQRSNQVGILLSAGLWHDVTVRKLTSLNLFLAMLRKKDLLLTTVSQRYPKWILAPPFQCPKVPVSRLVFKYRQLLSSNLELSGITYFINTSSKPHEIFVLGLLYFGRNLCKL